MDDRYYFTGKPCKNGHIANRLRSNRACIECERIRDRSSQNTGKTHSRWWTNGDLQILKSEASLEKIAKITGKSESAVYQKAYRVGLSWGSDAILRKSANLQKVYRKGLSWESGGAFKERNSKLKRMKTAFDLINSSWRK